MRKWENLKRTTEKSPIRIRAKVHHSPSAARTLNKLHASRSRARETTPRSHAIEWILRWNSFGELWLVARTFTQRQAGTDQHVFRKNDLLWCIMASRIRIPSFKFKL